MIRKNLARALSFCLVTGWIACHTSGVTALAAETDTSMTGELAFAQCEEYINIRQEPDENSEVVAKIYNDNAATIISKTGDWYQITSGNAFGYVKADYLVTGDEASAIAEKVQYHIARIHPEELYIRSEKSEESTAVGSVHQADEVDAVSYDNGAWIQIVADDGTEGLYQRLLCGLSHLLSRGRDSGRGAGSSERIRQIVPRPARAPVRVQSMAWRKRQSIRSRFPMIVKAALIPALWLTEAEMTAIRRAAIAMTAVIPRKIQTLRQRTEVRITVQIPPEMKAGTTVPMLPMIRPGVTPPTAVLQIVQVPEIPIRNPTTAQLRRTEAIASRITLI